MTTEMAKELVPVWANTEETPPQPQQRKERESMIRIIADMMAERIRSGFRRKYGILLIAAAIFTVYTILLSYTVAKKTEIRVTYDVTNRVTSELRTGFTKWLKDHDINPETGEKIEKPLIDDASFQASVEELTQNMDEVVSTYAMDFGIGVEGQTTIAWVWCARYDRHSTEFGTTAQEVTEKTGAWEGKVIGHATQNQYTELCRSVAREYLKGNYPDGFTNGLTFFNREAGGKIIARNELQTGAHTIYWWYGK